MDRETRARQAKALRNNRYLRVLFDEKRIDIREQWEATAPGDAETRERLYVEYRTLTELWDFIYARIAADVGGDADH